MSLRMGLILLAIVLVTILSTTLHKAIGLKSAGVEGCLFLGIRQMKVLFRGSGLPPLLRISRASLVMSPPIVSQ
jgi:hypothetical protein